MTNFNKKNYTVIKEAISKKHAEFLYNYFLIKKQVADTLFKTKYIPQHNQDWGFWKDEQIPGTYSHYGDIAMETLLLMLKPEMEKATKLKLIENYSYARAYKKGDVLHRHKDRFSCEISTTMNLGGDEWPIFIEAEKNVGVPNEKPWITSESDNKGTKVILNPGDMLVYKGNICEHWREPFTGNECVQVFLHYNNIKTKGSDTNFYDTRPHIGLPNYFKGMKL